MKTSLIILACFMALSAGSYDESYRLFQNTLRLGAIVNDSCHAHGMEVVKADVDLIGKGIPKQIVKKLSSDFKYTIYCLGEPSKIKNLNIKVYWINPAGGTVLVAQDLTPDHTAQVDLTDPTAGDYIILVDAVEMEPGASMGYFYLCIVHN